MCSSKTVSTIALIGFSATGKSAVAKKVAEYLNWNVVDTDDEIVRLSNKAIREIFKQDGEDKFRQLERQVLKQACLQKNTVIAAGGGAILNPENQRLLIDSSVIVCLESKVETIYRRLFQDTVDSASPEVRPLLASDNPLERIKQLKSFRQPLYAIADWTIHTDNLTLEEVSQEVIRGWRYASRNCQDFDHALEADLACMVETGGGRYPVYVKWGLVDKLGEKMKRAGLSGTAVIVSDDSVFSMYGAQAREALKKAGFEVSHYLVPPGEASKNIEMVVRIYDFLIKNHVERTDVLVALGGGMIGDLAGFVAATYLRGVSLVQVPTSLVGMVDASIGGKVAVDHLQGKNLIGAFYQPRLVLADTQALTSLPKRELTSGWSEVIKHGFILDAEFVTFLEANAGRLVGLSPNSTTQVVARSAAIKARVVTEDEKEAGKRIILNYGHTVAHGLEAASNYSSFLHGEAVAIGMTAAARLSQRLGLLSQSVVQRQQSLLEQFGLPVSCSGVKIGDVLSIMKSDKKVRSKAIQWVLLEDIGKVVIRTGVSEDDVLNVLKEVVKS